MQVFKNFDQIREYFNDQIKNELQPDKKGGYICPFCGSGSGANGSGLTATNDSLHWTCWHCGKIKNNSYLDIVLKCNNINLNDTPQILDFLKRRYNITLEGAGNNNNNNNNQKHKEQVKPEPLKDFTKDFECWHLNLLSSEHRNYLLDRGLTPETINRFNLGLNGDFLVIPTSKATYTQRNLNPNSPDRYRKPAGVKSGTLNAFKLEQGQAEPIFVVEGEFDCMSIEQQGFNSIGLGGITNIKDLLEQATKQAIKTPLIIALDNDKAGCELTNKVKEAYDTKSLYSGVFISDLEIYFIDTKELYAGLKDPNELLQKNPKQLKENLFNAVQSVKNAKLERIEKNNALNTLKEFESFLTYQMNHPAKSTGFKGLDTLLNGGLSSGLYVIGAISSLGKTSFCLQVADYLAKEGSNVLFFSLEMSKFELISKSLSRLTSYIDYNNAYRTNDILTNKKTFFNDNKKGVYERAFTTYREQIAKNIYIIEGLGQTTIETIKSELQAFKESGKETPIVFIDYLQLIQPPINRINNDVRAITDYNVLELKRLSRDFKTPIVVISSFNRENYSQALNLTCFKESGAIEYSSDVVIGLQYKELESLYSEGKQAQKEKSEILASIKQNQKQAIFNDITLKVLKNRNGVQGDIYLKFNGAYNVYQELS